MVPSSRIEDGSPHLMTLAIVLDSAILCHQIRLDYTKTLINQFNPASIFFITSPPNIFSRWMIRYYETQANDHSPASPPSMPFHVVMPWSWPKGFLYPSHPPLPGAYPASRGLPVHAGVAHDAQTSLWDNGPTGPPAEVRPGSGRSACQAPS